MNKAESNSGKDGSETSDVPKGMVSDEEFTRKFVYSGKEVEEGYYLLKSQIGGFTMLFPKNIKVTQFGYGRDGKEFEKLLFSEDMGKEKNVFNNGKIIYIDKPGSENIEVNLEITSDHMGYDGEYSEFKHKGKTYYYGKKVKNFKGEDGYFYFAYIMNDSDNKAITFSITSSAKDSNKPSKAQKTVEEEVLKLMKLIEFIN
ncbi:hypothetical protein [Bacillus massilinigeriensis]|uniref:hypothetical protein n=1 Tax=Bacillus mediterraneensis TaxID=1805474 RepID=UPI0008F86A25|nr:hypothetical protein [Bacillus mediterraneensis]